MKIQKQRKLLTKAYTNLQHNDEDNEDERIEDVDVEEAFINGDHRIIVDPEYEYEKERRLNKLVKDRLSQLGLSPNTLKAKQRKLARDLKTKLISKCAQQRTYERPPTTQPKLAEVGLQVKVLVGQKLIAAEDKVRAVAVEVDAVEVGVELKLAVLNEFQFLL